MRTKNMRKYKNLSKTLGYLSEKLISTLSQNKQNVFSIEEAAKILKLSTYQIRGLLHDLTKKGWFRRLQKGKYLLIPLGVNQPYIENQFIIGSKLVSPYYVGYWNMLNYYGYTEQFSNTIFIASTKRKRNRDIDGIKYKFIKLPEYKMFGITEIKIGDSIIKVSDKEKTLIDCFDHLEYCGGIVEVIKSLWNSRDEIDFEKILDYARKITNNAVIKRLGYIIEILGLQNRIDITELKKKLSKGFAVLDPLLPKKGKYVTNWGLLVNIPKSDLLGWKGA